ncbi:hypothetical protein JAAARDRAFT_201158 [Jaapia argillacea MUCL 33604]|uniref:Uncharacterized protein n=1 Tax=Jaapia argillacea MUCL 33604 TaxID=933084 RepID=A0A067P2C7_9AGAM|nr:hypothetical protein JAAARDRAFT_201158 [Jaapia argillacea MUCL 33604]
MPIRLAQVPKINDQQLLLHTNLEDISSEQRLYDDPSSVLHIYNYMVLQQYTVLGPKWPGAVSPGRLRTACKEIYDQFVIVDKGLTKINCSEFLGIEKDAINFDDSTFKDRHGAYVLAPDRYRHLFRFANYIRLSSRLWHELHGDYNGPELRAFASLGFYTLTVVQSFLDELHSAKSKGQLTPDWRSAMFDQFLVQEYFRTPHDKVQLQFWMESQEHPPDLNTDVFTLDWEAFTKTNPVDYGATNKGEDLQWWEESDNKQIIKTICCAIDNCRKGAAEALRAAPIEATKVQDDQTQQELTEHLAVDPGLGTPAVTNPKEVINVDDIQEDQVAKPKKVPKRRITALKQIEVQTPAFRRSLRQKSSLSSISNASLLTSKPSTSTSEHHLIVKTKKETLKGKERAKPSPSSIIILRRKKSKHIFVGYIEPPSPEQSIAKSSKSHKKRKNVLNEETEDDNLLSSPTKKSRLVSEDDGALDTDLQGTELQSMN